MPARELEIVFLAIPWMKGNRNVGLSWVHQAVMLVSGASWSPLGRARREPQHDIHPCLLHPASNRTSPSECLLPGQATPQKRKLLCLSGCLVISLYFNIPQSKNQMNSGNIFPLYFVRRDTHLLATEHVLISQIHSWEKAGIKIKT